MTTVDSLKNPRTRYKKHAKARIIHETRVNLSQAKKKSQPGFFETLGTFVYIENSLRELFANDYTEKLHTQDKTRDE